jgi:hypothetical protein
MSMKHPTKYHNDASKKRRRKMALQKQLKRERRHQLREQRAAEEAKG